ncbi:ABC transporter ATP-binding protein [Kitasatospora kifunensis]|uniref:Putative ABC transport system ATP-binding protein n=1 Tax=Kitasatospora kifunensis TaxID=58351 RepID=A0A7W7R805_KITKI|nr:ABC transporter ATP-binding protein [Kitasatospora kifunensis]MBB4927137.1 putative ABC transport system ATP-binding protein [Kitasatospora kifunensis]
MATAPTTTARPAEPRAEGALLVATDIHKSFGLTQALNGASLELAPGELVAVLGTSGSGKSTLLHCLAGLIRPDAGTVSYRGQDLAALPDGARSALRRADFGFVFQFGQLVPELSCLENVALPLRLNGLRRRPAEEQARQWLERLDVAELADKRPGELSGGQGQRAAIARALVTSPAVIFADEPTGALDSLHGEQVMALLTAAARESGAAVLLVTHDMRVAAYADREVVVRDGRTREAGESR